MLLLSLLLGATLAGAAVVVYLVRFSEIGPPPDAPDDANEPGVTVAVRLARERVLKERRSGAAWGELGEVFLANQMGDQAAACFAQAERFDANDPRWPYFRASHLAL
ncbi:MAG TPA: hypothetical protein VFW33_12325 [Gemmataceae bacterium]|nr:hypothetical protein [Gemmataceae bacterium]